MRVYSAGCALRIYKPELAEKIAEFLDGELGGVVPCAACCRYKPDLPQGTRIINTCAGCDRRFSKLYDGIETISLWEVLAGCENFPFPDYGGAEISVHDACPIRGKSKVHDAVRVLLGKMNFKIVEAENCKGRSVCCGDSYYGKISNGEVYAKMRERAAEMPCEDVCVYCVSCVNAMAAGGKKPRYLPDLLFGLETAARELDLDRWHGEIDAFVAGSAK